MSFSLNSILKDISNEQELEKLKEDLAILKENTYYSQKMFNVGTWTYLVEEKKLLASDEVYDIYESDYNLLENSVDGFNLNFHSDDKDEVYKNIRGLLSGRSYEVEFRIITKRGVVKFIKEKTNIIYDENGKIIRIVGVMQDITEQRIVERDLNVIKKNMIDNERIEGVGTWSYEVESDKYYWSDEVYNIHGIKPSEFENDYKNFLKFVHKDDISLLNEAVANALNGKSLNAEYRVVQRDRTIKYFKALGRPRFDRRGEVVELLGSIRDVSENKELNRIIENKDQEIQNIEEKFKHIIKESKEGYEIVDANGIIRYSSESVKRIVGYTPEEILNTTIYKYFTGEDLEIIRNMMKYISINPSKSIESRLSLKNAKGEEIYLEIYMINQYYEPSIRGIIVNYRDITEKVKANIQLMYDANHDKLTGLENRNCFLERLEKLDREAEDGKPKYTLMMLEIDGLKQVNFSLGHNIGDKLILAILDRLRTIFKDDNYISRYSGDNFAIIAEGKSEEEYKVLAEKVIKLFSKPFKIVSYELSVTVSIGICLFPKTKKDNLPLKNSAKVALARAKKQGKNSYEFYSPELNIRYYKEFALRSDLFNAIEKQQLEVYYQPFIDMNTNKILGAEALIRWNHPVWGLVPPGEFIAMAEETGLIIDIGKWVLKEVCKNYKKWIDNGINEMKLSVNFSVVQFFEKDFVKNLEETIKEFGLKNNFLIIEITENVLVTNVDKVSKDIKDLQSMGIQIALDDFGTGFSSLSYLSSLSVDILKLDRSFIKGIPNDKIGSVITRVTLKLAEELGIKLVAEGIETMEQLSFLKDLNCKVGQGYIYSKPKPLEEFEVLLGDERCQPLISKSIQNTQDKDKGKSFRVDFLNLLEADLTILEMGGEVVNIGNTKLLIKNMGPGGLSFISNIRFPIERSLILKFTTNLMEKEIIVYGNPTWSEEIDTEKEGLDYKIYQYGIEFRIDEIDRKNLIKILNEVKIKMRENILFAEGSFISGPYDKYFQ